MFLTFLICKRIFFLISFGIKLIDVFVKSCVSNIEEVLHISQQNKPEKKIWDFFSPIILIMCKKLEGE